MNVFVVGVGLIGGSMVLDIKSYYPEAIIYGIDTNEAHLEEALKLGVIDKRVRLDSLDIADIVIVSIPVDVQLEIIPNILDTINDDCLLIDVGSTKEQICNV